MAPSSVGGSVRHKVLKLSRLGEASLYRSAPRRALALDANFALCNRALQPPDLLLLTTMECMPPGDDAFRPHAEQRTQAVIDAQLESQHRRSGHGAATYARTAVSRSSGTR
jgi:hypothetical protein